MAIVRKVTINKVAHTLTFEPRFANVSAYTQRSLRRLEFSGQQDAPWWEERVDEVINALLSSIDDGKKVIVNPTLLEVRDSAAVQKFRENMMKSPQKNLIAFMKELAGEEPVLVKEEPLNLSPVESPIAKDTSAE